MIAGEVISDDSKSACTNQVDSCAWAIGNDVIDDRRVMTIFSTNSDVTLDIVSDLILLDDRVTIFNNQYTFFMVLIDFVGEKSGEGFFFDFDARLSVKTDQMVVGNLSFIVLAFD